MFLGEYILLIFLFCIRWNIHRGGGSRLCCQTHEKMSRVVDSSPRVESRTWTELTASFHPLALSHFPCTWGVALTNDPLTFMAWPGSHQAVCCWHMLLLWAVPWHGCAGTWPPGSGEVLQGLPRNVTGWKHNNDLISRPILHTQWDRSTIQMGKPICEASNNSSRR